MRVTLQKPVNGILPCLGGDIGHTYRRIDTIDARCHCLQRVDINIQAFWFAPGLTAACQVSLVCAFLILCCCCFRNAALCRLKAVLLNTSHMDGVLKTNTCPCLRISIGTKACIGSQFKVHLQDPPRPWSARCGAMKSVVPVVALIAAPRMQYSGLTGHQFELAIPQVP